MLHKPNPNHTNWHITLYIRKSSHVLEYIHTEGNDDDGGEWQQWRETTGHNKTTGTTKWKWQRLLDRRRRQREWRWRLSDWRQRRRSGNGGNCWIYNSDNVNEDGGWVIMFEVEEASRVFSRALNLFSFERMKWGKNRALKRFLKPKGYKYRGILVILGSFYP